jgi:hypothetical protein
MVQSILGPGQYEKRYTQPRQVVGSHLQQHSSDSQTFMGRMACTVA